MEVRIDIDTQDREKTLASLASAIHELAGIPPERSREGLAIAFDGYTAAVSALLDATDPDKVGAITSSAFMFGWTLLADGHARASRDSALMAVRTAALIDWVEGLQEAEA